MSIIDRATCTSDQATAVEELHRASAHRAIPKRIVEEPSSDCISCGLDIPQARQEATGGTDLCVECAQIQGY